MKIAQYTDSFLPVVDGVGRVVASYAQTLGEMGEEVTVFAPRAEFGNIAPLPYKVVPYNAFAMPGRMPYRVGFPALDLQFEKKMQHIPLDLVHVHSPFMAGHAGIQLAKKRGLPLVGSFHSKYYDDFSQALKVDFLAKEGVRMVVDFYEQCDEVWAVSTTTAETLREYGYKGTLAVMPNGTDIRVLDPSVLGELRTRYGLEDGVPLLLYVGQMNWKKNIRRILEAAAALRAEAYPFRLLLVGQGPHEEEIASACGELGIAGETTLTGHIQDTRVLDGLYTLASLFVFPSLYDNAPMVLREAAAMGTPAVVTEGSNAAEVIQSGVNGYTCGDDPNALAAAIRAALSDPGSLARAGSAARETIPIPWEPIMREGLRRYQALLSRRAIL